MRRVLQVVLCLMVLAGAAMARTGEVIDRIVAVVNRGVVLQSDLDIAVRYQALLEGRPLSSITDQDLRSTLDRLIDQELLFEEMGDTGSFALTDEEARKKASEIRAQFPEATTDESWRVLLQNYGLDGDVVQERVKRQVEVMRFIELRLRPNVRIDDAEIESYYRDQFLPRLRAAGGGEVRLDQVSGRIRQLLTEHRIDELLSAWLHNLREQSHIELHLESAPEKGSRAAQAEAKGPSSTSKNE